MVENVHGYVRDCNEFDLTAFGSGTDIISWRWNNINTIPATAITTTPNLRVFVMTPSQPSQIEVFALCSDGTEEDAYSEIINLTALQNVPPPSNFWAIAPPDNTNVSQNFQYEVACVFGASDQIQVSWSVSYGGGITPDPIHSYKAKVTFWAPADVTVTVTTTNICTGESHTLSKVVHVN